MNEQELKEILKQLEEAGWEPKLCDTSIPYYDNKVMCGQPTDTGDIVRNEYSLPRDFLKMQPEFVVTTQGNSMKGVDIADGDRVRISARQTFKAADNEIDNRVFDLYGLTDEEREVVINS